VVLKSFGIRNSRSRCEIGNIKYEFEIKILILYLIFKILNLKSQI